MEFLGYELDYTLRATKRIRAKFNGKNFMEVMQMEHDVDDMIKILHACVKDDVKFKDFEDEVYDNVGLIELTDGFKGLIMKIMNPGQDIEVTEKELGKLAEKAQD